jgi:hypothetical protein
MTKSSQIIPYFFQTDTGEMAAHPTLARPESDFGFEKEGVPQKYSRRILIIAAWSVD